MKKIAIVIDPHTISVENSGQFDPYAILHSGQVFRYWQTENEWLVMSGAHWAKIKVGSKQTVIVCDNADYFYHYFDFDTDYQTIKESFVAPKLQNALKCGGGIRILHADFVETVLSFIISANNNIKRFTKTLNAICEHFGTPTDCGYRGFPNLTQCSIITEDDFKQLGCGYRATYLVRAVKQLKDFKFEKLQSLSNQSLQCELQKISGVGPKVASCIMLFAFHRMDTAPVDIWIKKAIAQLSTNEQQDILHGSYAGLAQPYIYYYLQHVHKETL